MSYLINQLECLDKDGSATYTARQFHAAMDLYRETARERDRLRESNRELLTTLKRAREYLVAINSLEWPLDSIRAAISHAESQP